MFCVINYHHIAAYTVTSIIILLPPPVVILMATGYRGVFPQPDDTYKSSEERITMFRANTVAGVGMYTRRDLALVSSRADNFHTLVCDLRLFVILQSFFTTFLYMLKTITFFAHPVTKPSASALEFKNFDSILLLLLCLGGPISCGNAYVKHFVKFSDFFKIQC